MKAFIGIDPGKGGGIGVVFRHKQPPLSYSMPETETDAVALMQELSKLCDGSVVACIEVVHSSPQMGVVSAFTFGQGYGTIRTATLAAGIRLEQVRPQAWQKALGCLTKGEKNVTKALAQQLFPGTKITHKNADALLIAEWLRRNTDI